MPLTEDDAEVNPVIPQSHANYIRCMSDTHQQYARFFGALLIPQRSHVAFFRDLREFRSLPTTIHALKLCDPTDVTITKEQRKENYRNVTGRFLGSRYAHPWCRKAMAGAGNSKAGGWWGAEWSATGRRMSKEHREQEERLHTLLLPLWICFRSRMFPGDMVVQEWWEEQQSKQATVLEANVASPSSDSMESDRPMAHPQLKVRMATSSLSLRADEDLDVDDEHDIEDQRRQASSAVTGLLRVAAAGMLISSLPKMQQWKLKRELKKQKF